jgi:chaperone required for assembly of F1-ATPase
MWDDTSVGVPMSFMTGSVVGKRFYRDATVRHADDGNGWTVMLDYRTLKTPAKRQLKLHSRTLAMAIATEWEYVPETRWNPAFYNASYEACLYSTGESSVDTTEDN